MRPFIEDAQCVKCLYTDIGSKYCCDNTPEKGCWDVRHEHIHRDCQRCGYAWIEDTIEHHANAIFVPAEEG